MLTLAITRFDAHPDRVTDTLGIEPTSIGTKGEFSKSGQRRTFNGWWREANPERLDDGVRHAQAISVIVDLLRGREAAFQRLRNEVKPHSVSIYGGFYVPTYAQCGIWLDASDMEILAKCRVDWGLDLFTQEIDPKDHVQAS